MEEILNIEYHQVRLMIKSLNGSKTIKEASHKCGISRKTMSRRMKDSGITYDKVTKMYIQHKKLIIVT